MGLECVMIIMDNSVYARNGDVIPNRFQAQLDAIGSYVTYKTNENMESCVGLMTMGGKSCSVLSTPTNQPSQIYSTYSKIQVEGENNFEHALEIAQLSMKHRINKNQKERVVVFIASQINDQQRDLLDIARKYRRQGTRLDIVNICTPQNIEVIEKMMEIVNVDDESNFVNYDEGFTLLVDVIKNSPLMTQEGQQPNQMNNDYFDDELQMVLRISLEEEQKKQEELAKQKQKKEEEQKSKTEDNNQKQIIEAENIIKENPEQQKPDNDNEYVNDAEFIKEVLGELKMDDNEENVNQFLNLQEKDNDKKDDQKKDDQNNN